jgi:hypothetical protein
VGLRSFLGTLFTLVSCRVCMSVVFCSKVEGWWLRGRVLVGAVVWRVCCSPFVSILSLLCARGGSECVIMITCQINHFVHNNILGNVYQDSENVKASEDTKEHCRCVLNRIIHNNVRVNVTSSIGHVITITHSLPQRSQQTLENSPLPAYVCAMEYKARTSTILCVLQYQIRYGREERGASGLSHYVGVQKEPVLDAPIVINTTEEVTSIRGQGQ